MIRSLGMIKKACAMANHECGHLDDERTGYIIAACDEIIQGKLDCWFITDVIQGGAGTSTNMNANEVVANRAAQLAGKALGVYDYIHPNDHVNFGQSTNDVFPTAGKLTALFLVEDLLEELMLLQEALLDKVLNLMMSSSWDVHICRMRYRYAWDRSFMPLRRQLCVTSEGSKWLFPI